MAMDYEEKTISKREIYRDASYGVRVDEALMPNGKKESKLVIVHPGAVAILALNDRNEIAIVRQYRYASGITTLEIPAGKMDKIPNEKPIDAAMRELKEETGCTAERMEFLGVGYPTPGISNEKLHYYFASGLKGGEQDLDDDEFLSVEFISLEAIKKMILSGEIVDEKLFTALTFAKLRGLI